MFRLGYRRDERILVKVVLHWYDQKMQAALLSEYRKLDRGAAAQRSLAYLRLRRAIQNTIESGAFPPGQPLPSERDLARDLALSRVTVRKAIGGLVEDGLLTQRHGAGTFVADRIVKSFSRLTGFTDDLRARGLKPRVKFLERSIGEVARSISPRATIRGCVGVPARSSVNETRRPCLDIRWRVPVQPGWHSCWPIRDKPRQIPGRVRRRADSRRSTAWCSFASRRGFRE